MNILVIDSDPTIQSVFDFIMSQRGYNVHVTDHLNNFHMQDKHMEPDVIFYDISNTSSNHLTTIKSYLKSHIDCIIIGLVDYSNSKIITQAYNQGLYGVIFKPFDVEEVVSVVEHIEQKVLA